MVQRIINYLYKIKYFVRLTLLTENILLKRRESELLPSSPHSFSSGIPQDCQLQFAKSFDGKLLLRNEIKLSNQQFKQLVHHQLLTPQSSFQKTLFHIRCTRCNNNKRSLLAYFPCSKCHKSHLYCRNCIMMGRVSECEMLYKWSGIRYPWPKHNEACTWKGELTVAQSHASERVEKAVESKSELVVWAVTGAGKTEILFSGIELALRNGERVCIATPRADVVRELLPRIQKAFQTVEVQALYGKSIDKDATAQLIIATTHQLLRFYDAFDVIIIDEIDAFPYHHDESLQFATKRAAKQRAAKIYLTATPRDALKQKIRSKKIPYIFIPIRYHGHPLPVPKLIADFSLQKQLNNNQLPKSFFHWLDKRQKRSRQLLIFVPTIRLASKLAVRVADILLQKKQISDHLEVASVHAEDEFREEKVKSFRDKKIYALITTTILERGVTFPSVDVVILQANHEVFDEAALVQIAGRAGRAKEDPTGEVIFIHDGKTEAMVAAVHSIKSMNRLGKSYLPKTESDDDE